MFDDIFRTVQGVGDLAGPCSNILGVAVPAWSFGARCWCSVAMTGLAGGGTVL